MLLAIISRVCVINNFFAVTAFFGGDMARLKRAGSKVGLTWAIFIES